MKINSAIKKILYFFGRKTNVKFRRYLISTVGALDLGAWLHSQKWDMAPEFQNREDLFSIVAQNLEDKSTLYLEFGVFNGKATRTWVQLLKHPDTLFHGFDTFEGLPESWGNEPAGNYSMHGIIPIIDDARVQFFKGLFSDSLPLYIIPDRENVVINFDADLYAGTIYALRHLRDKIPLGAYIYFDEFNSINHEERAYRDFIGETGYKFKCLGHVDNFGQVMLQRIG